MKSKITSDISIYGIILAASLALAWWASTPKFSSDARQVHITSITPASIDEVVWKGANQTMTAQRREADQRFWIQYGQDSFLASERFEDTLNFFNPLEAKRIVAATANLSAEQWQAFGLKPPSATLTLKLKQGSATSEQKSWSIELGSQSFGTTDRYALSPDGKNIILLEADAISGFDNAVARFFDRSVLSKKINDAETAELEKGTAKKRFHRQIGKDKVTDRENSKEKPPFESAFNDWLEKVERLRAIRYADTKTEEQLTQLQPELTLKILNGERISEEITVKKIDEANKTTWWIFSSTTKSHVEISANRAEPVVKDAEALF